MAHVCLYVLPSGLLFKADVAVWLGLTPELHPFFAGTYFPPGRFRGVLGKLAEVYVLPCSGATPSSHYLTYAYSWEDDPERCRSTGKQVIEQLREATEVPSSQPLPFLSFRSLNLRR